MNDDERRSHCCCRSFQRRGTWLSLSLKSKRADEGTVLHDAEESLTADHCHTNYVRWHTKPQCLLIFPCKRMSYPNTLEWRPKTHSHPIAHTHMLSLYCYSSTNSHPFFFLLTSYNTITTALKLNGDLLITALMLTHRNFWEEATPPLKQNDECCCVTVTPLVTTTQMFMLFAMTLTTRSVCAPHHTIWRIFLCSCVCDCCCQRWEAKTWSRKTVQAWHEAEGGWTPMRDWWYDVHACHS